MARRSSSDQLLDELREPLERISEGNERIIETLNRLDSHIARGGGPAGGDPLTRHMRRYMPFYIVALAWAVMLVALPTVRDGGGEVSTTGSGSEDGSAGGPATIDAGPGAALGGPVGTAGPATSTRATKAVARSTAESRQVAQSLAGRGVTKAGVACSPGVRQIPWSEYAAPCYAKFEGDNGSATYRGVTKEKIRIVWRRFPDSANRAAVEAFLAQAGFASTEVNAAAREEYRKYFNKTFETYGREVEIVEHTNQASDGTAEAQGRGREQACVSAQDIAENVKGFAVAFGGGSEQFTDCAAGRKLGVFNAAAYYAETYYKRWAPYAWHGVMECERIAGQVAEYVIKRLYGKNAKWAGSAQYQALPRKFGTYVPDNEGYQLCVRRYQKILRDNGFDPGPTFNYTLDISRFADMATQAVLQFKAQGVTTLVLACDPISMVLLTQAAQQQAWHPEWLLIGVAGTDLDMWGNLTEQEQSVGHLFGMSQLGHTANIFAKDGEMNRTYKAATGKDLAPGATGDYFDLTRIYSGIQLAGPTLNFDTISNAWQTAYPLSGLGLAPVGRWLMRDTHTAIIDSKEVFWTAPDKRTDTSNGTYKITYGGRRFTDGEWPQEEPPVYPGGATN